MEGFWELGAGHRAQVSSGETEAQGSSGKAHFISQEDTVRKQRSQVFAVAETTSAEGLGFRELGASSGWLSDLDSAH